MAFALVQSFWCNTNLHLFIAMYQTNEIYDQSPPNTNRLQEAKTIDLSQKRNFQDTQKEKNCAISLYLCQLGG